MPAFQPPGPCTPTTMRGLSNRRWARLQVFMLACTLAACAASPATPPLLLTLPSSVTAAPAASAAPNPAGPIPVLAVRRPTLPEYLLSRRVRYRQDPSTLGEWRDTFWGERIEIGVERAFDAALQDQLPDWAMCGSECGERTPALRLQLDISTLDYLRSTRRLQAQARLTLSVVGTNARTLPSRTYTYELPGSGDTPQSQATVMGELLQHIARDAAALVRGAGR